MTKAAYLGGSTRANLAAVPSLQDSSGIVPDVNIGPLKFRTIRDLRELETLRPIWKSWSGTRDSDLAFFASAVRSRGSGCRPHVVVLTRDARPEIGRAHV